MPVARVLQVHRRIVWVVVGVLTLVLGWAARDLRFDFSPQNVYVSMGDSLEQAEAFYDVFGPPDAVLAVLLTAPDGRSVLEDEAVAWLGALGRDVSSLERVTSVDSVAEIHGEGSFEERVARLPLVEGLLVSEDRRHAALLVTLEKDGEKAMLFRDLATLRTNIPVFNSVDELEWHGPTPAFQDIKARLDSAPVN